MCVWLIYIYILTYRIVGNNSDYATGTNISSEAHVVLRSAGGFDKTEVLVMDIQCHGNFNLTPVENLMKLDRYKNFFSLLLGTKHMVCVYTLIYLYVALYLCVYKLQQSPLSSCIFI